MSITNIPGVEAEVDITIDWELVGDHLCEAASTEQAAFLHRFSDMKNPAMQAAYIGEELYKLVGDNDEARETAHFFRAIAEHIDHIACAANNFVD